MCSFRFYVNATASGSGREKKKRQEVSRQEKGGRVCQGCHLLPSDAMKARLFDLRKRGFNRLFQNGQVFEFSTPESLLDVNFSEPVFGLVDRLVVSADQRSRIVDAIEIGYREAGEVIFETAPRDGEAKLLSVALFAALRVQERRQPLRRARAAPVFFNNPYGACPRCQGFGNTIDFDLDLVIPDKGKTLNEGAIEPWTKPKYRPLFTELKRFARQAEIPLDVPWYDLEPNSSADYRRRPRFGGVRGFFQHLERKKYKLHVRVFLSRYRGYSLCSACGGTRLRVEARQVKIDGKNICQVCSMTVEEARASSANSTLSPQQAAIAEKLLVELQERLRFLNEVGLEYLTLDRLASTLIGRRSAAHSAGNFARFASGRHALRARRAFHRPAQPRYAPAHQDSA
jgi:excinuclease ABC subunit A